MARKLLAQDVLVLAKLISYGGERPSIAQMGADLGLSPSQIHSSIKRLAESRLVDAQSNRPVLHTAEEFLIHAVKYSFPAQRGEATRGMPTAHAAKPLSTEIVDHDLPPVWPDPDGEVRGMTFAPVHRAVPKAARQDQELYALLALVDAVRAGRAREQQLAEKAIRANLRRLLRG